MQDGDCTLGFNGESPLTEELKHRRDESIQSDRAEEKYEVEKIAIPNKTGAISISTYYCCFVILTSCFLV